MDVFNWLEVEPHVFSAGQPGPDSWVAIAAAGVKTVVNLRPPEESEDDEQPLVEAAGMTYLNLPVSSLHDIDAAMIATLDTLLAADDGLLVHCASGNRVGALFAFGAAANGQSFEAALARGQRAGLTRLAPQVAMLLQRRS